MSWINYTNKPGSVTPTTPAPAKTQTPAPTVKTSKYRIIKDVNVRKGPGVYYSRAKYGSYPNEIKVKMKKKYNYLPAGITVTVIGKTSNGWLKISDNLYIAGNYAVKI